MQASAATPQAAIKALWDILLPFSDYAFNKAHSAAYGLVSYWTAYLKANYPAEYMAALLTSVKDDKDKMAIYLNECRRMKIQVLPPDVNESDVQLHPGRQRHPLRPDRDPQRRRATSSTGSSRPARRRAATPTSTTSWTRSPRWSATSGSSSRWSRPARSTTMKHRRRALVAIHETAVDQYVDIKRNEAIGQDSLFGGLDDDGGGGFGISVAVPDIDEWDKMTLLGHEREMLGLYVSDHPLLGLEHVLADGSRLHASAS